MTLQSKSDIALGIINLVFQTIVMISIFATRIDNIKDIVLTGNLTNVPQSREIFDRLGNIFGANFHIPDHAEYATAAGAAIICAKAMPFTEVEVNTK